jgi:hypothetical protein
MQAPQYGAEVSCEEQQGDGTERDKERGDLVLGLVVVGVPDFGAERMVGGRIANEEVPNGYQHDEERSEERQKSELRSRHRGPPYDDHPVSSWLLQSDFRDTRLLVARVGTRGGPGPAFEQWHR